MKTLKDSRILIVGCGYVGSAVGKQLASRGANVVGTTTRPDRADEIRGCGIDPVVLDVNDADSVCDAASGCEAIYLCVGAGRTRPYEEIYLPAARSVVAALSAERVRRVIYTSSTGVYGQDDGSWVNEDSETNPGTDNGKVLVEAERILLDHGSEAIACGRTTVSVVRLGGIYGPGRELTNFVGRAAGTMRSDGDGYVNLVHLEDICSVMVGLLEIDHHGILNMTDDAPVTRREFYDTILAKHEKPGVDWTCGDAQGLGKRVSNQRVKALLNLKLNHPTHC